MVLLLSAEVEGLQAIPTHGQSLNMSHVKSSRLEETDRASPECPDEKSDDSLFTATRNTVLNNVGAFRNREKIILCFETANRN
jgi:hypothetical protein